MPQSAFEQGWGVSLLAVSSQRVLLWGPCQIPASPDPNGNPSAPGRSPSQRSWLHVCTPFILQPITNLSILQNGLWFSPTDFSPPV